MLDKLVIFLYAFSQCRLGEAVECVKIDRCSCKLDDGSGRSIDISKIGKQGGEPLIKDVLATDAYAYSFNPCYPFTEGSCNDVAGCQIDTTSDVYYDIGDPDSVSFDYDGLVLTATYTHSSAGLVRQSVVQYICNPSVDPPNVSVNGETSTGSYSFTIYSKYACPSSGKSGNCTQLDPCSCQLDDGIVDLSVLGKHGVPLISDVKSGLYYYSFNPCFPFNEGDCKGVAVLVDSVAGGDDSHGFIKYILHRRIFYFDRGLNIIYPGCQLENTTGVYIDIADATKVRLYSDGTNIIGNYTSIDGSRTTIVTYVCDAAKETPILVVNGEVALRTYGITIISKDVCPRKELYLNHERDNLSLTGGQKRSS